MAVAAYYPVFLNLKGRLCLVIGGGEVAERKVKGLLECEARVRIISPEVTPWLRDVAGQGEVDWLPREYREGDLKGAFLAIASTDRQAVNEAVAAEAAREKVVLNVVDNTPLCTFIAPSVVTRGDVTVAISTGGASPALARKLRESLESGGALDYAELAGILASARRELKLRGVTSSPDRWQESISGDLVDLVRAGRSHEALDLLMSRLLEGSEVGSALE